MKSKAIQCYILTRFLEYINARNAKLGIIESISSLLILNQIADQEP